MIPDDMLTIIKSAATLAALAVAWHVIKSIFKDPYA